MVNYEDINVKDIRRIKNRSPENMIVVDNLIQSFALDIPNGIPIRPFFHDPNDKELTSLAEMLERGYQTPSVKGWIASTFNISVLYNFLSK